jgi:hypothetical protein
LKAVREDLDEDDEEEALDSDGTQYDDKDALYEQDKVPSEESFGGLHYVSRVAWQKSQSSLGPHSCMLHL